MFRLRTKIEIILWVLVLVCVVVSGTVTITDETIITTDSGLIIDFVGGNGTFGNVTISGTLFGGSPVKIAGINITDNLFFHQEDINSSLRFTLQNLNDSINASTVLSARNDVNGSMSIGIGSSSFCVDTVPYSNVTVLFSRARGEMLFANFFNQSYIWLYNPQDDNNPANLVELMRLDENGLNLSANLTVTENISGNIHYAEIWFHDDTGAVTTPIAVQNKWYNISGFDGGDANGELLNGFTHDGLGNLTCLIEGLYEIEYHISFGNVGNNQEYQMRIFTNDIPQANTDAHRKVGAAGDVGSASGGGFIDLSVGDVFVLRIRNNDDSGDALIHTCNVHLIRIGD